MAFNILSAKLTGNPDTSGWSQTYDFKPEDPEKYASRGHLFALISTSSQKQGLDTVVAGREVLSRLHEEYFGKTQEKPYAALKEAVKKVIDEFSSWGGIEIAVVSVMDSILNVAVGGGSQAFIYRQGTLVKLIESTPGRTITASGNPADKDQIIIGSSAFFKSFSLGVIKGFLQTGNPNAVVESFAPLVHSQEFEGNFAIMVLRFNEHIQNVDNQFLIKGKKDSDELKEENSFKRGGFFDEARKKTSKIFNALGNPNLYLKEKEADKTEERNKKTTLLVGVLLLLILSVSIYFGVRQKRIKDFKSTYESQLVSAEHELQESHNLSLLNPQRSRELFDSARTKVLGLSVQEINDPKVEDLKQKIKEGEEKILGWYQADPQLFVDLALFSEGFKVDEIAVSGDVLYLLDKTGKKIIKVTLLNKKTESLAGPADVQEASTIAAYSGRVFVAGDDGLYELDNGRIKVAESEWGEILISAYAGNLYVLDKSVSEIYRFPATDTGFGSKSEWLREGTDVDLLDARNLVIDGSVWVQTGSDRILKFGLGNIQNFNLKGILPEIDNITSLFTSEESEFLYILEKDNGRIVVTDKDGEYKVQYLADGIKDAIKIAVSEKEKKVFLLTTEKLLFLDLKHLD